MQIELSKRVFVALIEEKDEIKVQAEELATTRDGLFLRISKPVPANQFFCCHVAEDCGFPAKLYCLSI